MPLSNSDLFVVQRGDKLFKVNSEQLKESYGAEAQVFVGPTPPTDVVQGTLWWSTLEGNLFIWYGPDPGSSSQWVDASPAFVEIDYDRVADELFELFEGNVVDQIVPGDNITISSTGAPGKGVVTINAVVPEVDLTPYVLTTDFEEDQQRQNDALQAYKDEMVIDQQRQDDEIKRLEGIIQDLADRLDQLEDIVAGIAVIDGGYPNAEGVFDEPETDGGSADPASLTPPDIIGGNAAGYD